jgi:hypothetical protein
MVDAIEVLVGRSPINDRVSTSFAIWRVPVPLRGSVHYFKYRLALIVDDVCVMRFDNESGKGDHKHVDGIEYAYDFTGVAALRRDFAMETGRWLDRHPDVQDRNT